MVEPALQPRIGLVQVHPRSQIWIGTRELVEQIFVSHIAPGVDARSAREPMPWLKVVRPYPNITPSPMDQLMPAPRPVLRGDGRDAHPSPRSTTGRVYRPRLDRKHPPECPRRPPRRSSAQRPDRGCWGTPG